MVRKVGYLTPSQRDRSESTIVPWLRCSTWFCEERDSNKLANHRAVVMVVDGALVDRDALLLLLIVDDDNDDEDRVNAMDLTLSHCNNNTNTL